MTKHRIFLFCPILPRWSPLALMVAQASRVRGFMPLAVGLFKDIDQDAERYPLVRWQTMGAFLSEKCRPDTGSNRAHMFSFFHFLCFVYSYWFLGVLIIQNG